MKYLKTYNESLRDKMKPKSNEEILKELDGLSPIDLLFKSAENNYLNGVKKALEKGVDINVTYDGVWNRSALIIATIKGYKDIVEFLIKNGADVDNKKNKYDWTALMYASREGYKDIVELLLKNGADVNSKTIMNDTALYFATIYEHDDIVDLLKKHGAKE